MFEPEYTRTMSSILDMIDKYGSFVLPEEEVSEKMLELSKEEGKNSEESEETTDNSELDACSRKTCVTPCFARDDADTYEEGEETERTVSEQTYEKQD